MNLAPYSKNSTYSKMNQTDEKERKSGRKIIIFDLYINIEI